ncbi:MAG: hypothetical protein GY880_02385 [Planctomycetaceae bacterium]|nr:hypothetical protein [Planctomycetaceae bacterium]
MNDIHPRNKRDVGARLARWAMAKNYGDSNMVYSGPKYKTMSAKGNQAILEFDYSGSGLKSLDGKPLSQFMIAGGDKKFVEATAKVVGNTVVVEAAGVDKPTAVRFGWEETVIGNLGNQEGLPAIPFRTDSW